MKFPCGSQLQVQFQVQVLSKEADCKTEAGPGSEMANRLVTGFMYVTVIQSAQCFADRRAIGACTGLTYPDPFCWLKTTFLARKCA